MRTPDRAPPESQPNANLIGEPYDETIGPQGAALILELRRLRSAFEQENFHDPAPTSPQRPARTRPAGRQPQRPQPRPIKGRIERAIDGCLGKLGFNSSNGFAEKYTTATRKVTSRDPPSIIAFDPIAIGNRRRSPQNEGAGLQNNTPRGEEPGEVQSSSAKPDGARSDHPSAPIDMPKLNLPNQEAQRAAPSGWLIDIRRSRLAAGFAFLVQGDALADNDNAPDESLTLGAARSFKRELRTGLRVLLVAILVGGGWLVLMPLSGAVVVPGNLVIQSSVKTIQHPTGGIVAEIPVHDGMRVDRGDLLLRLDRTQAQASLQVVSKQLDEVQARISRLIAERDGLDHLEIPPELSARTGDSALSALLASEQSLLQARSGGRRSQTDLLQSRVVQLGEQIAGLDAQVDSKAKQLELIAGELVGVQDLYDKHLVPLARLTTLQREAARIEGERGQLVSAIAETKAKIGEAQLQIVRLDQDFKTDVVKELGETRAKEAELTERGVAARDTLSRIELRAPTSGVVQQLSVHTIGGVIRAGDVLMELVPDSDELLVEARLQPNDIDQVRSGQKAFVRFSAFNQRITPQLAGKVSYVSPDISRDQHTNAPYYSVRVTLPEDEHRIAGLQLVAGMPAEVFMQTGSRTMLSYLVKPILDQVRRAFVER